MVGLILAGDYRTHGRCTDSLKRALGQSKAENDSIYQYQQIKNWINRCHFAARSIRLYSFDISEDVCGACNYMGVLDPSTFLSQMPDGAGVALHSTAVALP